MNKVAPNNALSDQQDHCLNCGHEFLDENYVYCPSCGQHTQDRLTLGILFRNTIASYLSLDSKFVRSLIPMFFLPGKVALEFVQGKRLKHLHPSQAYVMYSLVFFFVFSMFSSTWKTPQIISDGENIRFSVDSDDDKNEEAMDSLQVSKLAVDSLKHELKEINGLNKLDSILESGSSNTEILKKYNAPSRGVLGYILSKSLDIYRDNGRELTGTAFAQIPLAIFLSVPVYALFLWIINIRRRYTYAENLAHALFLFSFVFFMLTLISILIWVTGWIPWLILYFYVTPIYFLISFKRFYKQSISKSVVKLFIISFLFALFIVPLALGLTAILSVMFY